MNADQLQLLAVKGLIAEMPLEQQQKVHEAAAKLKAVASEFGEEGQLALMVTAMETAITATSGGKS